MGPPARKRQSLDFLLSILIISSPSILSILWKRIEFQFGRKMNISPRVVLAVLVVVALLVTTSQGKGKGKARLATRVEQGVASEKQGSFGFIGSNRQAEDGGVDSSEEDRKGGAR